jgi:hypothetical protein
MCIIVLNFKMLHLSRHRIGTQRRRSLRSDSTGSGLRRGTLGVATTDHDNRIFEFGPAWVGDSTRTAFGARVV